MCALVTGVQTCALPILEKLAPPMVVPWPQRRADVVDGIGRDRPAGIVQIARMRLQRAALRPLSFPTALSVSHHHMRLYGKTGSGGSSIASGRRLHAEEDGDAGDHGDGDGSQADGEAEQGDDAVTLGEADAIGRASCRERGRQYG